MLTTMPDATDIHSRSRRAGYTPEVLFSASALIVGAGAVGQNLAQNLALAGVGRLLIVDFDAFEPHNATRSPFFPSPADQAALGMDKATVVAHRAREVMTAADPTMRYASAPIEALGDAPFAWADIVFSAVDRPAVRAYLANRSRLHGKPMIEAGFNGAELNLSVYGIEPEGPCWQCSNRQLDGAFSCATYALELEREGIVPGIQNTAALLASLQAEAGIMWLHGQCDLVDRVLYGDIRQGRLKPVTLVRDPECRLPHRRATATINLNVGPAASLADLLDAIAATVGPAWVRLASPFIHRAWCTRCTHLVDVDRPEWRWLQAPYCVACGGTQPRSAEGVSPEGCFELDTADRSALGDLLALPAARFGMAAGTAVEVWPCDAQAPVLAQLTGTLAQLTVAARE